MDITITMLDGTAHTMRVDPDCPVSGVKDLIHAKLGVAQCRQRLTFLNGNRVELSNDSQTLRSYGLQSGSALYLLVTEPVKFQVFLKNEKGKLSTYDDITAEESVEKFKTRVQHREGVAVSQQRLVFQSREMMGGKLSDYGVGVNSTIDLCLRLRGG